MPAAAELPAASDELLDEELELELPEAEAVEVRLAELDEDDEVFSSSVACCLIALASAATFSISPPQGKFLEQYSDTWPEAAWISPIAFLTAAAVHFALQAAAILLFSSSVALIMASAFSISYFFLSISSCSASVLLMCSLRLIVSDLFNQAFHLASMSL